MTSYQTLSAQGVSLQRAGRLVEALDAFDAALALNPGSVIDLLNRGSVLSDLDRFDEALLTLGHAEELARGNATMEAHVRRFQWTALVRYGSESSFNGEATKAFELYDLAHRLMPEDLATAASRVFAMNYLDRIGPEEIKRAAQRVGALAERLAGAPIRHIPGVLPPERLRIGFVSADFRRHPVARFLAPVARLDPARFALYAYSSTSRHDEVTETLKAALPNWREIGSLTDSQATKQILADGIDILVDLSGYSAGGRMGIFARRPSPVQVTWLGYFATTGLAAMDYVLASEAVLPAEDEEQWVEQVWRLPRSYLAFQPAQPAVAVGPLPALRNGHVTFGSFNNVRKLSDATVAAWASILKRVPMSRLLLRTSLGLSTDRRVAILRQFGEMGIAPHRMELSPAISGYEAHLETYNDVDIALDTFPFNGATTTCEALWMGVPVITKQGDRFISRMGENILKAIGRPGLIAQTVEDYVATAVTLAADLPALAEERRGLRARLMASPIGDTAGFARDLEAAFDGMWARWARRRGDVDTISALGEFR